MNKYYIIWEYHDTFVQEYDDFKLFMNALHTLIKNYKNDSDFKYKAICGFEMVRSDVK